MCKFQTKFAATLKVLADNFGRKENIEFADWSTNILLEKDQEPNSETFREEWILFVERTLFELARDPKFKILVSELAIELFDNEIDESDVKSLVKSMPALLTLSLR